SAEDALARNCTFDPCAMAWVPSSCLYNALLQFFHLMKGTSNAVPMNISFHTFSHPNQQLSIDEASPLAKPVQMSFVHAIDEGMFVITTLEWHLTHCLYVLMKNVRSKETMIGIEPRYCHLGHLEHCSSTLLCFIKSSNTASSKHTFSQIDIYP
ncbi:hypothetical protein COCCADRAFT_103259, partial [Bipolaris zeicola 26-R-13]